MSAHTPGPWSAQSRSMSDGSLIVTAPASDFEEICQVVPREGRSYGERDKRHQANAVLIAVAPELLEALEMARDNVSHGRTCATRGHSASECTCFVAMIDAVLSKARGES